MSKYKLNHTGGPYGDATCHYKATIYEPFTLQELIDEVLNNKNEWGYFTLVEDTTTWLQTKSRMEYRYGEIINDNIPIEDKTKTVEVMEAHGGWTRMDYIVSLKLNQ